MNNVFRAKLILCSDLPSTYALLQSMFDVVNFSMCKPKQIVVRMNKFSILLFSSGQCRFMGRLTFDTAQSILSLLSPIYSDISAPLTLVSQTVVFQIDSLYLPINMYKFASSNVLDVNVHFQPELFPSIALHHWKPLHVNVFSTGKVTVLGQHACSLWMDVRDWLYVELLFI